VKNMFFLPPFRVGDSEKSEELKMEALNNKNKSTLIREVK